MSHLRPNGREMPIGELLDTSPNAWDELMS